MAELCLRGFLQRLRGSGELLVWRDEVDIRYGVSRILKEHDGGPAILFESVKGHELRVVGNVVSKRDRLIAATGASSDVELYKKLLDACSNPLRTKPSSDGAFMEVELSSLKELPILIHYEGDGGPYITSGIVVARDPETDFQNASFHRMMVIDDKRLVLRIVPRHLYRIYEKYRSAGKDAPVAVMIGCHPAVMLAAASSPPYGVSELHVANRLLGGRLETAMLPEVGLEVERWCEVVLVGRLLRGEIHDEGPFVDITGTYDIVRKQPVMAVDRILVRSDAMYQALLPAGSEHRVLMGFFREALIWSYTSRVAEVKAVRLTKGGCGWLHCVISIRKATEGDGKNVILAAFAAHPSLKMVVVVDDDIDVDDPSDVEWAVATRFQADRDLVVIGRVRGSSLDPSADQRTLLTTKMGIDATRTLTKPSHHFERARIPS